MGIIYLGNILHKNLIYSEYTFINPNTPNYIPYNSQNTPLYTHKVTIKLVTFAINGTLIVLLG
jgi:hypothetical protein